MLLCIGLVFQFMLFIVSISLKILSKKVKNWYYEFDFVICEMFYFILDKVIRYKNYKFLYSNNEIFFGD